MRRNYWKKAAACILAFTLVAGSLPANTPMRDLFGGAVLSAHAETVASGECGENVTWSLDGDVLTISGTGAIMDYTYQSEQSIPLWYNYREDIREIVIEDGVTGIGANAFYNCTGLISLTIPDSVTWIGDSAFFGCINLASLTIPASVTSIGEDAFSACFGLTEITVSDENTYYRSQDNVLFDVTLSRLICCAGSKEGAYTVPDSVKTISDYAFYYCTGLTDVTIPDSVEYIGLGAFFGCAGLTGITVPDSVMQIGNGAFSDCINLNEIVVSKDNPCYCSLDNVLFDKRLNAVITAGGKAGSFTIPDGVTNIDAYAFYDCAGLTGITLPDSMTCIGEYAFYSCSGLKEITVPQSVTSIGEGAFFGCENLRFKGYTGSYAETYANENGIPFTALDAVSAYEPNPDLNYDGEITATDAQIVLLAYAETLSDNPSGLTPEEEILADVDGSGTISALDAQYILTYFLYNTVIGEAASWSEIINPSETYTPTLPLDPEDIDYFIAYGKYDPETGNLFLNWNERPDAASYDITLSANVEDTLLDTVTDALVYSYAVPESFETGEFTISYQNAENETVRTPAVILNRTEDGFAVSYIDTDSDGLVDPAELQLGTDLTLTDTDEDGLSDYDELIKTGTDPTVFDSYQSGVSDGDADPDEDGLTNAEETALGTSTRDVDTDADGLTDGREVKETMTDPLTADTDGDGLDDYFEVQNGLDPLAAETNGTADIERQIEQTVSADSDALLAVNNAESPYTMSVKLTTNGNAEKELEVLESLNSASLECDAQIGDVISLSLSDFCSPTAIRLEYAIKDAYVNNTLNYYTDTDDDLNGIQRLCVFKYYDEIGMLLPVETFYDTENNSLYADVDTLGDYCIMDLEIWYDLLGLDANPSAEENDETAPEDENAPENEAGSPEDLSDIQPQKQTEITGKAGHSLMSAPYKMLAATPSAATPPVPAKKNKAPLDLVFILQTAGPYQALSTYNAELSLMEKVTDYVFKSYSDVRVYVVDYKFDHAEILRFSGMDYCTNVTALSKRIRSLKYDQIGNEDYCETKLAFQKVTGELKLRKNVNSFIYHLHNGSNLYNTELDGIQLSESDIGIFSQILPVSYVFNQAWYEEDLATAIRNNGGLNLRYTSDAANKVIEHIAGMIDYTKTKTEFEALVSRNLKKITLDGKLSPASDVDTDRDALRDWDEVRRNYLTVNSDGSVTLPTIGDLIDQIDNLDHEIGSIPDSTARAGRLEEIKKKSVLPCKTDPSSPDTDDDGYTDLADPNPTETPVFLNGEYDFMHNEVYYLRASSGKRLNHSGASLSLAKKSDSEEQQFRFSWEHTKDYKITTADGSRSLTLVSSSSGGYTLEMQSDSHYTAQRWEVLPYDKFSADGFVLRCKAIDRSTTDDLGKPLYLSFGDSGISVVTEVNASCILNVDSICKDWKRFGQLYMEAEDWTPHDGGAKFYDLTRAFSNYRNNNAIVFNSSTHPDYFTNSVTVPGVELRIGQSFDQDPNQNDDIHDYMYAKLKYADAPMNDVICEVMGTYNAMCMAKGTNDAADFLRLVAEFEMSGRRTVWLPDYVSPDSWLGNKFGLTDSFYDDGGWGSRPELIENCLKAYRMPYMVVEPLYSQLGDGQDPGPIRSANAYDDAMKDPTVKAGILTYSFSGGFGLHTFAVDYNGTDFYSYNNKCWESSPSKYATILETLRDRPYYYGYVLY